MSIHFDEYRRHALEFEQSLQSILLGMDRQIRLLTIAIFSRGHVLLEGDVGVGKTTLLRAAARLLGGAYQRIEGSVDLMPSDFLYHAYLDQHGQPAVSPGPLLQHEEKLTVFFFNEINRARPHAHALLLRVMAERSVTAFNREYHFPHLTVFADRNRLERDETYELPAAARDRFLMELNIRAPCDAQLQRALMFNAQFQQVDALIQQLPHGLVPYLSLNALCEHIQQSVRAETALQNYAVALWDALTQPQNASISLEDVEMSRLLAGSVSPRGMGMLMAAARTRAWLEGRDYLTPDDIRSVFHAVLSHRIFLTPAYALRSESLVPQLLDAVLDKISVA